MKKLSLVLALLAMAGVVLITGCGKSESTPTEPAAPTPPATNAPAQ